ncbi:MAG TPA: outer membrane protein assembly factor BamA [Candidatus Polarisedimenticolia bacterium]|jgi:outer membrane protein assembly complex protein YaeT
MADRARLKRWTRRVLYTLLGVPAAAALALFIYVWTGHPESLSREKLTQALSRALGRPVVIESVSLQYLPPGVVLRGLRTEGPRIEAPRAEASLSLRALLRGLIVLKDVDVWEPVLEWRTDTERFLPARAPGQPAAAGPGPLAARLDLRRLRIHGGTVVIGSERRALSAEIEGLQLHADNTMFGYWGPYEGTALFHRGRFALGDLQLSGLDGSLSFEADRESIRTKRLRLKAEGVDIRASGQVQPGTPVRGRFEGEARLDPAGPSLRRPLPQFGAKELTCDLRVTLSAEGVKVNGTFVATGPVIDADRRQADDGSLSDGPAAPWTAARGAGTFSVEPGRIEIGGTLESFSGGTVEGRYVGVKYGSADETPREHEASITAKALHLDEVLGHFDLPGEDGVTPSALLSGDATVRWTGSRTDGMAGTADLAFDRLDGELPLSGTAMVDWRGSRVTVESSFLQAPGAAIELAGIFDATAAVLGMEVTAELSAGDTRPLASFLERRFPALGRGVTRPTDLIGRATAHIEVEGTSARPEVRASFESDGLTVQVPALSGGGGAAAARVPIPLTAAAGDVVYRTDLMRLDLRRAEGADLSAQGALRIRPGRWEVLDLDLDATALPAALAARLAGIDQDRMAAGGILRGGVHLAGPDGTLRLESEAISLGPLAFTNLKALARIEEKKVHFDEISLIWCGGLARGHGAVDLAPPRAAGSLEVSVSGIDLGAVDAAYAGPSMSGSLDAGGRLTIDGDVAVNATLAGRDVHIAGIDLGGLEGTLAGPVTGPDARLRLELKDELGSLKVAADFGAGGSVEGTVAVRGFSLEEVRPLLPRGALAGLKGEADGTVTVTGPLREPSALLVRATLDRLALTAGDDPLRNDEPVRVTVQDGFLTVAPMRLIGERTDLTLGGSMALSGHYDVTARVAGTFDLSLAELIAPEMRATGLGTADLHVIERGDVLTYAGGLTLQGGTVRHPALPLPLENLRGRGSFTEQGLLNIEELRFDTGGGHATGAGWVRFEGAGVPQLHLALTGQGIRAEILPDLHAFFDAEMALDKDSGAYRFGGRVSIQRAVYTRAFGVEPTELLLRGREFAPARERGAGAPVVFLDIAIAADRDVWIRNEEALIEASAHLSLQGTLDEPELSGRISALEGGTYRFRDVTYRIVGGALDFADVARIDPLIDIEAVTRVQQYEITLRISGRFSRPIYDLASDPALPQRDVVWLLMTGNTLSGSESEGARTMAEGQVAAYLATPVTGAVSAPLEKILGVSSVQLDPFFLNGTADPSARLTVTKRMASNLLFTYSASLGQNGQEIYQIEYNPGRLWDLLATRDLDGSVGADVRIRRRWRGWGWTPPGPDPVALPQGDGQSTVGPRLLRIGSVSLAADHLIDSQSALVRRLPFDEGDLFRRGDLLEGREILREQYVRRGFPAAEVDLIEGDAASLVGRTTVDVQYAIRSGPRHELAIQGDVGERPIRKAVLRAWREPILLDDLVEEARKAALGLLRRDGYYSARVEARMEAPAEVAPRGEPVRTVSLSVEPGPKVHVHSVSVTGNRGIPEERIRRQMLTRVGGFTRLFGRGLLKEPVLKDDVAAIRGLYLANGYLAVRIATPVVTLSADGKEADVAIAIEDEGPQARIGAVVIEGEAEGVPGEDLLRAAGLSQTQVVNAEIVSLAADRVREALDHEGYSRARVSTRLEGEPQRTRVVFSIIPLGRVRVHEVLVEGNTRTLDRIVDREIPLNRGDYLTRSAVLTTQRNLYRLGVFRSVEIDTLPVEGKPGFVDVRVRVQEGSPLLTAWGVGYDSKDRARASFEIANNNLFGTRRSAALFVRGSAVDRRVQVTLRDPNLFGEKIETLMTGFVERQELESFDLRRVGSSVQLSRKLGENTTLFGRYRLEDINLFDLRVPVEETGQQTVRLASVATSMAHDTRDDIINPSRGGFSTFDVRLYHRALGSEEAFVRTFASANAFKEIGRGVVWASSARIGLVTSHNIPISERFFAGGDTTLRGFRFNTVGPLEPAKRILEDPNSPYNVCPRNPCDPNLPANPIVGFAIDNLKPVGGNALFLINQELRFPIFKALKGVVFYDAGNVYARLRDFDVTDLRHVLGTGLRFDTPLGPFRVEYGRKLDHDLVYDELGRAVGRRPESRGEFFFSIGQAF